MKVFIFFMLVGLSLCDDSLFTFEDCVPDAQKILQSGNPLEMNADEYCTLFMNDKTQDCLKALAKKLNDRADRTNGSPQAQAEGPCQEAVTLECLNALLMKVAENILMLIDCSVETRIGKLNNSLLTGLLKPVDDLASCLAQTIDKIVNGVKNPFCLLTVPSANNLSGQKKLAGILETSKCANPHLVRQRLEKDLKDLMGNGSCCNKGSGLSNLLCNDKDQLPMKDVLETVICINKGAKIPNKQINDWVNAIGVMPLEDFLENLIKKNGITCPAKPSENETTS